MNNKGYYKCCWYPFNTKIMTNDKLTEQELLFCELYATGDAPFTGNAARCYIEAFPDTNQNKARSLALKLLSREDIAEKIEEFGALELAESKAMKSFLSSNLKSIVQECASASYRDRRGTALSPAPLRSVAVSAAKALMDLHPVKEATVSKLSIDGGGESGITFNVIMPSQPNAEPQINKAE